MNTLHDAVILHVGFTLSISPDEYEQAVAQIAPAIADVPGLQWKIWVLHKATNEAGGLYLFEDRAAVRAYLDGPIIAKRAANPACSNLSFRLFDCLDNVTAVTRGPFIRSLNNQSRPSHLRG